MWTLAVIAILGITIVVLSEDTEAVASISLSIQDADTASVTPGSSATFKINVTNLLTTTSLTVNLTNSTPPTQWTAQLSQTSITVPALSTKSVTLTVGVPNNALADSVGKQVIVTADPDFGDSEQITTTTKVSQTYGIQTSTATPSKNTVGGSTVTFNMLINNTGNGQDTVAITHSGQPGTWTVSHVSSSTVPAGSSRSVTITVVPPSNATAGTYQTTVKATSNDGSTNDQTTFIIIIDKVYGLTLSSSDVSKYVTPNVAAYYNLSVTNTGNTADNAKISIVNPPAGWTVLPTSNPVFLNPGETKDFQVLVTAPNTVVAGTQVQIAINATSNGNASIVRQLSINAVVNQVYDPRVTPQTNSKVVAPGSSVTFKVNVTNNGNGDDTVDLSLSGVPSGQGWVYNFNPVSVALTPGQTKTVDLTFTIGTKAAYGDNQVTIIGTSHGTTKSGSTSIVVSVSQYYSIALVPVGASTLRVDPGGSIDFTFSVTNTGNGPDDITFSALRMEGNWVSYFSKTTIYNLPANSSDTTVLTIEVPSTTNSGTYRFDVKATSDGNASVSRTIFNLTIIVNQLFAVLLDAQSDYLSGPPGTGIVDNLTVTNDGSGTDNVTISVVGQYASWVAFNRTTVMLAPGASTLVRATITPPANTPASDVTITFRATSKGRTTVYDEVSVQLTVEEVYAAQLTAVESSLDRKPTETALFTVQLRNRGNTADTFKVNFTSNPRALATNSLASPFVALASGAARTFTVSVTVPAGEPVGNLRFVVLATSENDTAANARVTLTVVVQPVHGVNLYSFDATASTEPTDNDTVELRVANTGNGQDTYSLKATGPYYRWAAFERTSVTVPAGEEVVVNLTLTVPDSTATGTYTINVTATSTTDATATRTLAVRVTVLHKEDLDLYPSDLIRRRSTDPGGSVVYTVTVENLGVRAHVVNLALSGQNTDWAMLNRTYVIVQGGATSRVKVTVTVPEDTSPMSFDLLITGTFDDNERRTASLTMITTVNTVRDVITKLNDTTVAALPGNTITVTLNVNNTGNAQDTFDLGVDVNDEWFTFSPGFVTLAANANTDVTVRIAAPDDPLTPTGMHYINVTATSRGNTSVSHGSMLEFDVEQVYALRVKTTPVRQSVDPGTNALYNITITNQGNGEDTFVLTLEGTRKAWGRLSRTQVKLGPDEEAIVVLTVRIPSNQPVEDATIIMNVTSSGGDDVTSKVTTTTTINPYFGVTLTVSKPDKNALPGKWVVFEVKVKNTGNSQDTFNFEVLGDYASWVATMDPLTIDPGKIKTLEVNITPPDDIANGIYDFTINGSSDTQPEAYDTVDLELTINVYYGLFVTLSERFIDSRPDANETVLLYVENLANVNDTYGVRARGQYSSWVSIDNTTLGVDEGETGIATAVVRINTTLSGSYVIPFEVTSHGGGNVSRVELTINITLTYGVSLISIKQNVPGGPDMENLTMEVEVVNAGNTKDTFDLSIVQVPGIFWEARLDREEVTIDGGGNAFFNVSVDIPKGVEADTYQVRVRAISTESPNRPKPSSTIPLNITIVFGVDATGPSGSIPVLPEDTQTIQVAIENTGYGPDIVMLEADPESPNAAWLTLTTTTLDLGPSQSTVVDVLVTPPVDTETGLYVIRVKATSVADPDVYDYAVINVQVLQVYGVLVEPGTQRVEGAAGKWHEAEINITNLGNGEDTFAVDANPPTGAPVDVSLTKSVLTLAPGEEMTIIARIKADSGADSDEYVIDITVRSRGSTSMVPQHVTVTYQVPPIHSVEVRTDTGGTDINIPGAEIGREYQTTIVVHNTGNIGDTYFLSVTSDDASVPGWFLFDSNRVTIAAGESHNALLSMTVPIDAVAGIYSFTVMASSETEEMNGTMEGQAEVVTYRSVTLDTDVSEATLDPTGGTGGSARFTLTVNNDGNVQETVTLVLSYPTGWTAPLVNPESVTVAPFSSKQMVLEFTQVPTSAPAQNGVTVKAKYGAFTSPVVNLVVRVLKSDVAVSDVVIAVTNPKLDDLVDVTITLSNTGDVAATGLTVVLIANEVEVGQATGQSVPAGQTSSVTISWQVSGSPGDVVTFKVRIPQIDLTHTVAQTADIKEEDEGLLGMFKDMEFHMLIIIGLVLGLILGLLVAGAVRGSYKKRLEAAHAAGMAEGMSLAESGEDEEEGEGGPPGDEEEGEPSEEDLEEEGPEEGEMEEEVTPVVVQCPKCDTLNSVTTSQRPYEFRCETCNALLRLKQ